MAAQRIRHGLGDRQQPPDACAAAGHEDLGSDLLAPVEDGHERDGGVAPARAHRKGERGLARENREVLGPVLEDLLGGLRSLWGAGPGELTVEEVRPAGPARIDDVAAVLRDARGERRECRLSFDWPIKLPIRSYREKFLPVEPLTTKVRIIDTFFPVAKGGTYCIPGPFGAGKTVLQQITSRYADVDIVIIAACGERAGEIVETMREFPTLTDPRTGRSLMERTIIICNTSSMPVAARESSVYTAVTIAEYYRQMGLHVLLLADSTSRWAQAMREMSGRLEEIPGEEAFPAYLESRIASFYERAGMVRLHDGSTGSVTIGGTVSPAGGNFDEPVTQATLKVVGAFHGLSRSLSDARRYPAIDPLISWSKYPSIINRTQKDRGHAILRKGFDVAQMMKVVGEEGTALADYVNYLKAEFFDFVYLQQNAFDRVDEATARERQVYVMEFLDRVERKGKGWNLCLQTLDGILCHDGEVDSGRLTPDPIATTFADFGFWTLFYIVGVILVAVHVSHGFWSGFQTLGLSHPKYMPFIEHVAVVFSLIIGIGFASIPVFLFLSL